MATLSRRTATFDPPPNGSTQSAVWSVVFRKASTSAFWFALSGKSVSARSTPGIAWLCVRRSGAPGTLATGFMSVLWGMWHWEQVAPRICWKTEDCHSTKVRSMSPPGGAWMS